MVSRLTLALAGLLGFAAVAHSAPPEGVGAFAVVELVRQQSHIVLGGTVVPARQVSIAAQLPGRVEFLAGMEGDSFSADTLLVALNDDELLARRRAALAEISNAEARMRNAGMQYTRELASPYSTNRAGGFGMPMMFDQMFTRGFSDMMGMSNHWVERQADLYDRGVGIEQAQSAYAQARSQLEEVEAKLKDTQGYAPFEGVITRKLVEVGDIVQPGQPLIEFADTRFLEIQVQVPARLMPGVREGAQMMARLDVQDHLTPVTVSRIFPMADPGRHTVTVKYALLEEAPAAPGMYAEVMVTDPGTPLAEVPAVPQASVVRRGSLPALFVLNMDGRSELRAVRLGESLPGEKIAVLSGVRPGERVLLNPPPGMKSR